MGACDKRATAATKDIWRKNDDNWFAGGVADPNVRVIRMEPTTAELWDGSSSAAVSAFEFAGKTEESAICRI